MSNFNIQLLLSWSISPIHLLPGVRKMGQFEGVSIVKMCPTLCDAFMTKSVSKCSLFIYILELTLNWTCQREKMAPKIVSKIYTKLYLTSICLTLLSPTNHLCSCWQPHKNRSADESDTIAFFSSHVHRFSFLIWITVCAIFRLKEGTQGILHNIFSNINITFLGLWQECINYKVKWGFGSLSLIK